MDAAVLTLVLLRARAFLLPVNMCSDCTVYLNINTIRLLENYRNTSKNNQAKRDAESGGGNQGRVTGAQVISYRRILTRCRQTKA